MNDTVERLMEILYRVWDYRADLSSALRADIAVELRRGCKPFKCCNSERCTHVMCPHKGVHAWDERCDDVCNVPEHLSVRCLPEKESK
jgi:hypothetical protein